MYNEPNRKEKIYREHIKEPEIGYPEGPGSISPAPSPHERIFHATKENRIVVEYLRALLCRINGEESNRGIEAVSSSTDVSMALVLHEVPAMLSETRMEALTIIEEIERTLFQT